jgi:tRNA threonylcarbamoyladenosine biosynthesis protein TsaB
MCAVPVLALDTSGEIAVCLVAGSEVLARRCVAERRRHAELLAPMIAEVLADGNVVPGDLTAVVVGTGPAPFTGLRAGLVTARVMAFALGIEVHGVCSLDALAAQAYAGGATGDVLAVIDARRREVFAARYQSAAPDVVRTAGPVVAKPAVVAATMASGAVVVGDGLPTAPGSPTTVDPAFLAQLAAVRLERGEDLPTTPLYLRRPDVTPAASPKRVTG